MDTPSPLYYLVFITFGASSLASIIRIFRVYLQHQRGSQSTEVSPLLFIKFRYLFLALNACQILFSLGLGLSFILPTFNDDQVWLKFLFSSIVLSSMVGQVRKAKRHAVSIIAYFASVYGQLEVGTAASALSTQLC